MTYTCTSTTRPANPVAGMEIFQTDTIEKYLCTVGGATPTWVKTYPVSGGKILIQDTLISGAAVDYVDFPNLSSYERFELELSLFNPVSSDAQYRLFFNGDYTLTNYYNQWVKATGTSVTAARENAPNICYGIQNSAFGGIVDIYNVKAGASYNYPRYHSFESRDYPVSIVSNERRGARNISEQITSIRVASSVAGSIGIGSRLRLWGK